MTETGQPTDMAAAWARLEAQKGLRASLAVDARPRNKAALFNPLAAARIQLVVVTFDGAGDEGQIEEIAAYTEGVSLELPDVSVEIVSPVHDGSGVAASTLPLKDAIVALAYDFLEETHGGWENSDGAYGEFRFDVVDRSIELDFNERFISTEFSSHEF